MIKKFLKWIVITFIVLFMLIFIIACVDVGNDHKNSTSSNSTATSTEKANEVNDEDIDISIDAISSLAEMTLNEYDYSIYEKDGNICLDIVIPGAADDLVYFIATDDFSTWDKLVLTQCNLSSQLQETIELAGAPTDCYVVINTLDTIEGEEKVLISCMKGTVIFDISANFR